MAVSNFSIGEVESQIAGLSDQIATKETELSFATNSYYSLDSSIKAYKFESGKTVTISAIVICNTAYYTSPGYEVLTVPAPKQNLFFRTASGTAGEAPLRVVIGTGGKLYLRYGQQSGIYDLTLTYICA